MTAPEPPIELRRLRWVGPLTIGLAVGANLIVRELLMALISLPREFPPLQPWAIALFTALGVAGAVGVFWVVARLSPRPLRTYRIVAGIALVLSAVPNLALLGADPRSVPFPGLAPLPVLILLVFHVVAAAVSVGLLTTLTVRPSAPGERSGSSGDPRAGARPSQLR
ncbi:DUF6069 family protein [Thermoflexus sp.]|jgi:hypothetical protein|uniref:DUF6069 family protein n=1 Tax=Thermoflexus sp. TaxID=1969742 RepID=UPI001B2DBD89|nr:hypothetical protein [Thermoflexus sp.]